MTNRAREIYRALLHQFVAESYVTTVFGERTAFLERVLQEGNNNLEPVVLVDGLVQPNALLAAVPTLSPGAAVLPGATRATKLMIAQMGGSDGFEFVLQTPNDPSGFSATVLRSRRDPSHYTVAFRSTEFMNQSFGGDYERDGLGADIDLALRGGAWAQLAAADAWFMRESGPGGVLAQASKIDLTGYSLGSHVAMALTELHVDRIHRTTVFNGPGRGQLRDGYTLRQVVDAYREIFRDPLAMPAGFTLFPSAVDLQRDAVHVASNPDAELAVAGSDNVYHDPRHQWASRRVGLAMQSRLFESPRDMQRLDPAVDAKITYVYGMATHNDHVRVSLSGVIPVFDQVRVLIEDQPLFGGNYLPFLASDEERRARDFMRTHSITLIADSVALSALYAQVDASLPQAAIDAIFAASSNRIARSSLDAARARAEADTLERALDALRWAVLPEPMVTGRRVTPADDSLDGFGNLDFRNRFFDRIDEVSRYLAPPGSPRYALMPLVTMTWTGDRGLGTDAGTGGRSRIVGTVQSRAEILSVASADTPMGKAYRAALEHLSPFALHTTSVREVDGQFAIENFSTRYLIDRTLLLHRTLKRNLENDQAPYIAGVRSGVVEDLFHGIRIEFKPESADVRAGLPRLIVRFGRDEHEGFEEIRGAEGENRLYGRGGDDWIFGGPIADHLEGNDGDDILEGGDGADALSGGGGEDRLYGGGGWDSLDGGDGDDFLQGGPGRDELRGGKGNDFLSGGVGFDTYITGLGMDTIDEDADGGAIRLPDGVPLTGAFLRAVDRYVWTSVPTVEAQHFGATLVVNLGAGNSVTILGFKDGAFGIHLVEKASLVGLNAFYEGDRVPEPGDAVPLDEWGNPRLTAHPEPGRVDDFKGAPGPTEIHTHAGADSVTETWGGNDVIDLGAGDDFAYGGDGDDELLGGEGRDILSGGDGNDRLYANYRTDLDAALRRGLAHGIGVGEADWLAGGAGDDWLYGEEGNDVLSGGLGRDRLVGGAGHDLILGDAHGEARDERAWLAINVSPSPWRWTRVEGSFEVRIEGDLFDPQADADSVYGPSAGGDVIFAGSGDDLALGYGGDDFVYGGPGQDVIAGNDGDDVIHGDEGDDILTGDSGQPLLRNGHRVQYGDDVLRGGTGNDRMQGEGGEDTLDGEDGDDLLIGDGAGVPREFHGSDVLRGGDGDDILDGGGADDFLFGGSGRDHLIGGEGQDFLTGGGGDDLIDGGDGADVIDGGPGRDVLRGGPGDDVYIIDDFDLIVDDEGTNIIRLRNGATPRTISGSSSFQAGTVAVRVSDDTGTLFEAVLRRGPQFQAGTPTLNFEVPDLRPPPLGSGAESTGGIPLRSWRDTSTVTAAAAAAGASSGGGSFVIEFDNGESLSFEEFLGEVLQDPVVLHGGSGDDILDGYAGDDRLSGAFGHDRLYGHAGDDHLDGGPGDDWLAGGPGDDYLEGGQGADTYVFGAGDGRDIVAVQWDDIVRIRGEVAVTDLELLRFAGGDLELRFADAGDRMRLVGAFSAEGLKLDRIEFSDGSVIAHEALLALPVVPVDGTDGADTLSGTPVDETIRGLGGDDFIDGGAGNDRLEGGPGADSYAFDYGMGWDEIVEPGGEGGRVVLSAPLSLDALFVERRGTDVALRLGGTFGLGAEGAVLRDAATAADRWTVEAGHETITLDELLARSASVAPDDELRREFRWRLVRAHDGVARSEGLSARPEGLTYRSAPFVWEGVQTRLQRRVETLDTASLAVSTSTTDVTPWSPGAPSRLSARWRELAFQPMTLEAQALTLGNATVLSSQWQDTGGIESRIGLERQGFSTLAGWRILRAAEGSGTPDRIVTEFDVRSERDAVIAEVESGTLVRDNRRTTTIVQEVTGTGASDMIEFGALSFVAAGDGDDIVRQAAGVVRLPLLGWHAPGVFVDGGAGRDRIAGSALADVLIGGLDDDVIHGFAGNDVLAGGDGRDILDGGEGADRYVIRSGEADGDVITDVSLEWVTYEAPPFALLESWAWNERNGLTVPRRPYGRDDPLLAEAGLIATDTLVLPVEATLDAVRVSFGTATADELGLTDEAVARITNGEGAYDRVSPLLQVMDLVWGESQHVRVLMGDWTHSFWLRDPEASTAWEWGFIGGLGSGIENITFGDGRTLRMSEVRMRHLQSSAFVFEPGAGDVTLGEGGAPAPLVFGGGVRPWDIDPLAVGTELRLQHRPSGETVTLQDWFGANARRPVTAIVFDDSGEWSLDGIGSYALARSVTAGDDVLIGDGGRALALGADAGDDVVIGTAEGDLIDGGAGLDWIEGLAGDDILSDESGGAALSGGEGNDSLRVAEGVAWFSGGAGSDVLATGGRAAVMDGGAGDDRIESRGTHVLMRFRPGDGVDTVMPGADSVTISVKADLPLEAVRLRADQDDLWVEFGTEDRIRIVGALRGGDTPLRLQWIRPDGVLVHDLRSSMTAILADGTVTGVPDWAAHRVAAWTDRAYGGDLALIEAAPGNPFRADADILAGVAALAVDGTPQALTRPLSSNTPPTARQVEAAVATEGESFAWTMPADLFDDRDSGDRLALRVADGLGTPMTRWLAFDAGSRTLTGMPTDDALGESTVRLIATDLAGATAESELRIRVQAHPGRTLSGTAVGERLAGTSGPDRLEGREGDDILLGGLGDDVYVMGRGDGVDTVVDAGGMDTLSLGPGIGRDDVWARTYRTQEGWLLRLRVVTADETGIDVTWTGGAESPVERVRFADGSERALSDLLVPRTTFVLPDRAGALVTTPWDDLVTVEGRAGVIRAQGGDDRIHGSAAVLVAFGDAGNDLLRGQQRGDFLTGGAGHDILLGGAGPDSLRGGAGRNVLLGEDGSDWLFARSDGDFLAGGPGDDHLQLVEGQHLIAFNRGDGRDRIEFLGPARGTLSLGGGLIVDDIVASRQGSDLVLSFGEGDAVSIRNWYGRIPQRGLDAIQVLGADGTLTDWRSMAGLAPSDRLGPSAPSADLEAVLMPPTAIVGGDLASTYATAGGFGHWPLPGLVDTLSAYVPGTVPAGLRVTDWRYSGDTVAG